MGVGTARVGDADEWDINAGFHGAMVGRHCPRRKKFLIALCGIEPAVRYQFFVQNLKSLALAVAEIFHTL